LLIWRNLMVRNTNQILHTGHQSPRLAAFNTCDRYVCLSCDTPCTLAPIT